MVYWIRTLAASTKSSPPSRNRTVLVPVGVKVDADVGYARTVCLRSTTAVDAGGNVKSRESSMGASPPVEIIDSSELMLLQYAEIYSKVEWK